VSSIGLERYYQSRKQQAVMSKEVKEEPLTSTATSTRTAAAAAIRKEKIPLSNNDLVESLAQITKRRRQELEQSLARLQDSDLKKISELCCNYCKLQHYSNLITFLLEIGRGTYWVFSQPIGLNSQGLDSFFLTQRLGTATYRSRPITSILIEMS
jgi:hypothetical protein